eukprot:4188462-Pyramimonas_sp.AAC.1
MTRPLQGTRWAREMGEHAHVAHWGIKECGWPALASEYCWFTACVVRSSLVAKLPGKLSQLMRGVLKFFCGAPDAVTDLRNVVAIGLGGRRCEALGRQAEHSRD